MAALESAKSLPESRVLCKYIGNYYYRCYLLSSTSYLNRISVLWLACVCFGIFWCARVHARGFSFRLWRVSCVVDEGKFRLMPRVDAPFVRVCVLSVVGGTGVGKFWMFFLCFPTSQCYSYSSAARYGTVRRPYLRLPVRYLLTTHSCFWCFTPALE